MIKDERFAELNHIQKILDNHFVQQSVQCNLRYLIFYTLQGDLSDCLFKETVDYSSGVLLPYYDSDIDVVYLAGKVKCDDILNVILCSCRIYSCSS